MDQKQRLFIYDRKEMIVLVLLSVMVALFAFTLGVHLGKNIGHAERVGANPSGSTPAATVPDEVPNRQDLTEQAPGAPDVVDENLSRALHDEVAKTGIKLDHPRPVELPETQKKTAQDAPLALESIAAAKRPSPSGHYTLQVGSHQKLNEAKDQVDALEALGLRPFLRAVDLETKGRWYRVYLGGFVSREDADSAGARFRAKKMIESFVVANMVK
jgi:cell division septation protein DedD